MRCDMISLMVSTTIIIRIYVYHRRKQKMVMAALYGEHLLAIHKASAFSTAIAVCQITIWHKAWAAKMREITHHVRTETKRDRLCYGYYFAFQQFDWKPPVFVGVCVNAIHLFSHRIIIIINIFRTHTWRFRTKQRFPYSALGPYNWYMACECAMLRIHNRHFIESIHPYNAHNIHYVLYDI